MDNWLITEYSSGYTLFSYQAESHPVSIYTLPEAFEGTDHVSYCDLNGTRLFIYFSLNAGSIIKFDLNTRKYTRAVLIVPGVRYFVSKFPIFESSGLSRIQWFFFKGRSRS